MEQTDRTMRSMTRTRIGRPYRSVSGICAGARSVAVAAADPFLPVTGDRAGIDIDDQARQHTPTRGRGRYQHQSRVQLGHRHDRTAIGVVRGALTHVRDVVPGSSSGTRRIIVPITGSTIPPKCGRTGGRYDKAMPCWSQSRRRASLLTTLALSADSSCGLPLIGHTMVQMGWVWGQSLSIRLPSRRAAAVRMSGSCRVLASSACPS